MLMFWPYNDAIAIYIISLKDKVVRQVQKIFMAEIRIL